MTLEERYARAVHALKTIQEMTNIWERDDDPSSHNDIEFLNAIQAETDEILTVLQEDAQ